jgi:hypothetical protein
VAEHEPSIGKTDEWYPPRSIFDALGLTFDLDPCSPGPDHWVPARRILHPARRWTGAAMRDRRTAGS